MLGAVGRFGVVVGCGEGWREADGSGAWRPRRSHTRTGRMLPHQKHLIIAEAVGDSLHIGSPLAANDGIAHYKTTLERRLNPERSALVT
jgi:hypothetical protein